MPLSVSPVPSCCLQPIPCEILNGQTLGCHLVCVLSLRGLATKQRDTKGWQWAEQVNPVGSDGAKQLPKKSLVLCGEAQVAGYLPYAATVYSSLSLFAASERFVQALQQVCECGPRPLGLLYDCQMDLVNCSPFPCCKVFML